MVIGPQPHDIPLIRRTLALYKVSSIVTGVFLLGLVVMMVCRYGFGVDIELGANGIQLTDKDAITGFNISIFLLTVHGWLYVVYLACDFVLWRVMRWSFGRFLWIAMGGVIPFLSFFFERRVPRAVEAEIARIEAEHAAEHAAGQTQEAPA